MFDHVTIRAVDRGASEQFYSTVLEALGIDETYRTEKFSEWKDFSLTGATAEHPRTRGLHVGFVAPTRAQVDQFWKRGTDSGYSSDGEPGERPEYRTDYYGAFLLDPDGNSAEAVHYDTLHHDGIVDHVWIRVADLAASQRFYETVAPYAGFWRYREYPERIHFAGETGSFSIVAGPPTENLHLAFPSHDDSKIQRFHEASVNAGYRSNGGPGERPRYHPGYYAAYVLDPDGNNIELVNHHRD